MSRRIRCSIWVAAGIFMSACCWAADAKSADAQVPLRLALAVPLADLKGSFNHLAIDVKTGRFFVTAPGEKKVVVVDVKAGKVLRVLSEVPASAACFLPELDVLCLSGG